MTAAPCWCVQVVYDVRGMLQKNRDPFRDDVLNLLKESRSVCSPSLYAASVAPPTVVMTMALVFLPGWTLSTTCLNTCTVGATGKL